MQEDACCWHFYDLVHAPEWSNKGNAIEWDSCAKWPRSLEPLAGMSTQIKNLEPQIWVLVHVCALLIDRDSISWILVRVKSRLSALSQDVHPTRVRQSENPIAPEDTKHENVFFCEVLNSPTVFHQRLSSLSQTLIYAPWGISRSHDDGKSFGYHNLKLRVAWLELYPVLKSNGEQYSRDR